MKGAFEPYSMINDDKICKESCRFGTENPYYIFGKKIGYDHCDGILFDIIFNTRMLLEWHALKEKEKGETIDYTKNEKGWIRWAYEEICYFYQHEAVDAENLTYMLEYLEEFFLIYDERESAQDYKNFKADRWERTSFPDGLFMDKSIW